MAIVEELTGHSPRRIVLDNELVFPNVQTCVAIVASLHGSIAGADIRAVSNGGGLEFSKSHDGGGTWKAIDNAEFS